MAEGAIGEYSRKALSLAIYPGQGDFAKTGKVGTGLLYVSAKLTGECGEFSEKVGKCLRDSGGVITEDRRLAMLHELGDVLWYINALCSETTIDFSILYSHSDPSVIMDTLRSFEAKASTEVDEQLFFLANRISFYAASIGSIIVWKDTSKASHSTLYSNMKDLMASVKLIAQRLDSRVTEVMRLNLEKLFSRKDRGVLKGEGDSR